ncbi:hypothetical protein DFH09DRAFT_817837, partial [Mycena vulgaris]
PRYDDHRDLLRAVSPTIHLLDILGTKDGIAALAKFIEKPGVFTKTGMPRPKRTIPSFEDEPEVEEEDDSDEE